MTREELDAQSKPELIEVILRQQTHIADLQAQIARLQQATQRNGPELADLATVPPGAGRFPSALRWLILAGLALTCSIAVLVTRFRPGMQLRVGQARDFEIGQVYRMHLPAQDESESDVPIFLVNDPVAGFLALHRRDTRSNCLVQWEADSQRFEDPCQGSTYARSGEYLAGPAPRGLDRYTVVVTESGEVQVDVSWLLSGPARP